MIPLNLPPFEYRLREEEGRQWIFDVIRKKFIVLTPEEWVRQHVVNYLVVHLQYPRSLIKVEGGLSYNQRSKRSDILVRDREGKPWMIIECKAPSVRIDRTTVNQAAVYNTTHKAKYIVVNNGLANIILHLTKAGVVALEKMPPYDELN